jgi:membrane associated rhomboid family serine protease
METQQDPVVPEWAREDAFPVAPAGWGWVDQKGRRHVCDSKESLIAAIREDRDGSLNLVWSPEQGRMVLPEELGGALGALRTARECWTSDDLETAQDRMRWLGMLFGGTVGYAFFTGWVHAARLASQTVEGMDFFQRLHLAARTVLQSGSVGLTLLMFLIFAFIPWYQARKRRAELETWSEQGLKASIPGIRFETWLGGQRAPLTQVMLGLMTLVAVAQVLSGVQTVGWGVLFSLFHGWEGIAEAGLQKARYFRGEWWRLFTAPFLHGNVVHFLMNAAALLYLGKRLEVFARWPHLPLVFLFSACIGGEATARFVSAPSVGASGGLMGWLGFLLVFETLHSTLVPRSARRRLVAGVLLTGLIGLVGYRFIDNAAHAGGLVAGMVYALIVFPKSSSASRPRSTLTDRVAGIVAMLVLGASAALAMVLILR